MFKFLVLLLFIIASTAFAHDLSGKSFRLEYQEWNHYEISFEEDSLTWKCVQGDELGNSETDSYKLIKASPNQYIIQWMETSSAFITLMLDLNTMKVYSSGVQADYTWLREGNIKL